MTKNKGIIKVMYLHGLGSSPLSRTALRLSDKLKLWKNEKYHIEFIAPEIPMQPLQAMDYIHKQFVKEEVDIVIGSSLGGFYTMTLGNCIKVVINPAMHADEDIENAIGLGTKEYVSTRSNPLEKTYIIDETFINELKEIRINFEANCFDEKLRMETYGFFGDKDELFSHYEDFIQLYKDKNHVKLVDGNHRVSNECIDQNIIPFIYKICDALSSSTKDVAELSIHSVGDD